MTLAGYAVKDSKGREHDEDQHSDRTPFEKDRDRIYHCRTFRRIDGKTQVVYPELGDHYRTRLTHTLAVAQISRGMARVLGLNEDLTEAIALAHDLGHTPFGHAGEMAMDRCMQKYGRGFEHNEQSKRVVTLLERGYPGFPGLNLTFETLDGLSKHQTPWDNAGEEIVTYPSLEAQVVNLGDEIAYSNHDIDDGVRSGILSWKRLIELPILQDALAIVRERYGDNLVGEVLQDRTVSTLIGMMIDDVVKNTQKNLEEKDIRTLDDVYESNEQLVNFSGEFADKMAELKEFLQENFYLNEEVLQHSRKGEEIIERLFNYYVEHPEEVPELYREHDDDIDAAKDYVAGMTDGYARGKYDKLAS